MPYFQNELGQMKNIGNVFNVFVKYGHIRHGGYLCVCETGISDLKIKKKKITKVRI